MSAHANGPTCNDPTREHPVTPGFVVELKSPTDPLALLQDKMSEYMAAGAQLGWLIDAEAPVVFLYRAGVPPERLEHPAKISGDPVLPGLVLDRGPIWAPGV